MNRLLASFALLFLVAAALPAVQGETLYKWVDEQGNVHYSDKPQPGATKLHLPKPTTYAAPNVAMPAQSASTESQKPAAIGYTSFEIASPAPDQTFWNTQSVTVTVAVQPALQAGDTITISLDDKSQGPGEATSASFDGLDRGEHTARATLQMATGGTMTAKTVVFYIQRGTQKAMH